MGVSRGSGAKGKGNPPPLRFKEATRWNEDTAMSPAGQLGERKRPSPPAPEHSGPRGAGLQRVGEHPVCRVRGPGSAGARGPGSHVQSCKVTSETMGGSVCLEFLSTKEKSALEPRTFWANRSPQQWPGPGGGKVSTERTVFLLTLPSRPITVTLAGLAAISFEF